MKKTLPLILLSCLFLLFSAFTGFKLDALQVIFACFFLLFLFIFLPKRLRAPLFLPAILFYLLFIVFNIFSPFHSDLTIANLSGDDDGEHTYQLLQDLKITALENGQKLKFEVEENSLLHKPLKQNKVSGGDGWLNFSSENVGVTFLSKYMQTQDLLDLAIITGLPNIGYPLKPHELSIDFTSDLTKAEQLRRNKSYDTELSYNKAAAYARLWSQTPHLAYAKFMAGNENLFRFISSPEINLSELVCAKRYYSRAKKLFENHQLPELEVAVDNNLAVVYYLEYIYEVKYKYKYKLKAKKILLNSKQLTKSEAVFTMNESVYNFIQYNRKAFKTYFSK